MSERLTISALARRYNVSEDSVRRWIKAKKIPFTLTGANRVQAIDPAPLVRQVPPVAAGAPPKPPKAAPPNKPKGHAAAPAPSNDPQPAVASPDAPVADQVPA